MFSEACVKNSVNKRGACMTGAACMVGRWHDGGMCGRSLHGQGACMVGGGHRRQGACVGGMHDGGACVVGACVAEDTATAADGTHPTGMHSC